MKILLEIHTENTDDASKDRHEDAYLIYPKDNHIKSHLGFKLHLLYSLIKQQFSFCPKYRMSFIFNFPIWHDYLTYEVTKLQPTPEECFISILKTEKGEKKKKTLQVSHTVSQFSQLVSSKTVSFFFFFYLMKYDGWESICLLLFTSSKILRPKASFVQGVRNICSFFFFMKYHLG